MKSKSIVALATLLITLAVSSCTTEDIKPKDGGGGTSESCSGPCK